MQPDHQTPEELAGILIDNLSNGVGFPEGHVLVKADGFDEWRPNPEAVSIIAAALRQAADDAYERGRAAGQVEEREACAMKHDAHQDLAYANGVRQALRELWPSFDENGKQAKAARALELAMERRTADAMAALAAIRARSTEGKQHG